MRLSRFFVAVFCIASSCVLANESSFVQISPDSALAELKKGNERVLQGKPQRPHQNRERLLQSAAEGQNPFAIVLSCSDSRVPVEEIFDQGIGDLFIVRIAGNSSGGDTIGSVEYSIEHLGSPLVLVLGHTKCGAVEAAATKAKTSGHLTPLISRISPAVRRAQFIAPEKKGAELVSEATSENAWLAVETLFLNSKIVREKVKTDNLQVVAAIYDVETGEIKWLGKHPKQNELLRYGNRR